MAVIVAEYLGKRTDSTVQIEPIPIPFQHPVPDCPFNKLPCKKMNKETEANFPICSLRRNGELYIVCEHRLVSTSGEQDLPLSPYQAKMLLTLAKEVFYANIALDQVLYKSEVRMKSKSKADYMLSVTPDVLKTYGPRRLIVEMQGGGETSNTGTMTRHLEKWSTLEKPTNRFLSSPLPHVGLIQTNAWRRLQEQIFAKASVAALSGYGFVACIGTILFDSVTRKIDGLYDIQVSRDEQWDVAIITYCEDKEGQMIGETIPLRIDQSRTIYTTYEKLVAKLVSRGLPDLEAFEGTWRKLSGESFGEDDVSIVQ